MTTLIVLTPMSDKQLDRIWDDTVEAMSHETRTGFVTRVVLTGWHKNGLPVYEKIPNQLTYIEWRNNVTL